MFTSTLTAQSLAKLIDERDSLYTQYDKEINSSTGFFGLQTKGDLKKAINTLKTIIKTDNAILQAYKREMNQRNTVIYNKQANISIEKATAEEAYQKTKNLLHHAQDELSIKRKELEEVQNSKQTLHYIIFGLLILLALVWIFK